MEKGNWKFKNIKFKKNQVQEFPATLNILTPTPAPDRGGPVAWVGGLVAQFASEVREKEKVHCILYKVAFIIWATGRVLEDSGRVPEGYRKGTVPEATWRVPEGWPEVN